LTWGGGSCAISVAAEDEIADDVIVRHTLWWSWLQNREVIVVTDDSELRTRIAFQHRQFKNHIMLCHEFLRDVYPLYDKPELLDHESNWLARALVQGFKSVEARQRMTEKNPQEEARPDASMAQYIRYVNAATGLRTTERDYGDSYKRRNAIMDKNRLILTHPHGSFWRSGVRHWLADEVNDAI